MSFYPSRTTYRDWNSDRLFVRLYRPIVPFNEDPRRYSVVYESVNHLGIIRYERPVFEVVSEIVTINGTITPVSEVLEGVSPSNVGIFFLSRSHCGHT